MKSQVLKYSLHVWGLDMTGNCDLDIITEAARPASAIHPKTNSTWTGEYQKMERAGSGVNIGGLVIPQLLVAASGSQQLRVAPCLHNSPILQVHNLQFPTSCTHQYCSLLLSTHLSFWHPLVRPHPCNLQNPLVRVVHHHSVK